MDTDLRAVRLSELVERHYALVYWYAYRLSGSEVDAEDLTQQTFLCAQLRLGQLRDFDRAKTWLCTILRNLYLKQLRSPRPMIFRSLEDLSDLPAGAPLDLPFDQDQLQSALDELPEEYRSPIILFYFGEFSYKQIAEQMDVPVGTIMSRLARAKAYLRRRLVPCPTHS